MILLGGYLSGTWLYGLMPASYYSFAGGVSWPRVATCLLAQDAIQYLVSTPSNPRRSRKNHMDVIPGAVHSWELPE